MTEYVKEVGDNALMTTDAQVDLFSAEQSWDANYLQDEPPSHLLRTVHQASQGPDVAHPWARWDSGGRGAQTRSSSAAATFFFT